jgi:hypothetical protein
MMESRKVNPPGQGTSRKARQRRRRRNAIGKGTVLRPINRRRRPRRGNDNPPPLIGLGKYTEAKGRKAYKKRKKAKKSGGNSGGILDSIISGVTKMAPHILPLIAGFGDYDVHTNSILEGGGGNVSSQVPEIINSGSSNIMRHREMIGVIRSTTAEFSSQVFKINPGLDELFPWLSVVAANFTSYQMRGLCFEFKSRATEYSSTPALGFVAMATQYNSLDQPFTTLRELENYEYATSCKPSEHMIHPVECAPDKIVLPRLYIRTHGAPTPSDLRLYDMGQLNVAVGGQSTTGAIIGELWATFEIQLLQPKLAKDTGRLVETDGWTFDGVATNPLGTTRSQVNGSTFTGQLDGDTYLFPQEKRSGYYLLMYSYNITAAIITAPTFTLANCAWMNNPASISPVAFNQLTFPNSTGTTNRVMAIGVLKLTGGGQAGLDFVAGTPVVGSTAGALMITQLPETLWQSAMAPKLLLEGVKSKSSDIFHIGEKVDGVPSQVDGCPKQISDAGVKKWIRRLNQCTYSIQFYRIYDEIKDKYGDAVVEMIFDMFEEQQSESYSDSCDPEGYETQHSHPSQKGYGRIIKTNERSDVTVNAELAANGQTPKWV